MIVELKIRWGKCFLKDEEIGWGLASESVSACWGWVLAGLVQLSRVYSLLDLK